MLKKFTLFIFLIGLLLGSCKQEESPYFKTILISENGHFRGISIGDNIDKVKTNENKIFLVDKMRGYLHYDYEIDMGNSYTVSYDFSKTNLLYEIETTVYLDDITDAPILFNTFHNHFSQKYGKGKVEEDNYTTWKTISKKTQNNIEIAMLNESISYGIISIKIRNLDY